MKVSPDPYRREVNRSGLHDRQVEFSILNFDKIFKNPPSEYKNHKNFYLPIMDITVLYSVHNF